MQFLVCLVFKQKLQRKAKHSLWDSKKVSNALFKVKKKTHYVFILVPYNV